jgi:chorismate mutase
MNPALRRQLLDLDRALLALLDERARLLALVPADDPGRGAGVEDLLRRHDGPFPAPAIEDVFAAVDRGCSESPRQVEEGSP